LGADEVAEAEEEFVLDPVTHALAVLLARDHGSSAVVETIPVEQELTRVRHG
jgi:hypothetical protein